MNNLNKRRVHIYIKGRVQGVGFRYSTYNKACELGLYGWVRNTFDGCVEAVFEGNENVIGKMIEWCSLGSSLSRVDNIEVLDEKYTGEFNDFGIRR